MCATLHQAHQLSLFACLAANKVSLCKNALNDLAQDAAEKLRALDARSETIEGYSSQAYVGTTAIRRVSNGLADVAVGHEREALHVPGVQFVPLQQEWVDIVIRKTPKTRTTIRTINDLLVNNNVRREFAALAPCDVSRLGVVVYES